MIGAADLARFCETTMQIAGGDVRAQLDAWNVDHDEFFEFTTAWANRFGQMRGVEPREVLTILFCGFELGYRSCAEGGLLAAVVPDAIGLETCAADGCDRPCEPGQHWCDLHWERIGG